ncbi:putative RNA-binding protein with PIN domain [Kineococcus xinjiangensis]|uniref:Putative RNA-binding protein with PIN domain n=1 Tax=Kineococcus xinjiangensis TaxID=512762 RepID=A0A2S6IM29_9ACTN|nr:NYN domain-containing protein [Kineococcus xinjiangensis]PPK95292.1 putative RNA-binding protein with PIN domain [Kineococcus xinjiangensis]
MVGAAVHEDDGRGGNASPGALPEPVLRRALQVAAEALGALDEADVPAPLRRVRAFAPARRARAGAQPLTACLATDPAFGRAVADAWSTAGPGAAAVAAANGAPVPEPTAAPLDVAVAAYLLRAGDWRDRVRAAAEGAAAEEARRAGARTGAREARDQAQLEAQEAARARELAELRARVATLEEELTALRRELRRSRSDADRARAGQRSAERAVAQAQEELAAAQEDAGRQRERADAVERQLREGTAQSQQAARRARDVDDVRARLLLDTLLDAAAALRRELALPPVESSPADLLAAELLEEDVARPAPVDVPGARALAATDPAALDHLLALPRAHLVVDGYNVTKLGFGQLTLLEQRRRLVDGLGAIAARTGVEVTCCFDGNDGVGPVPSPSTRRVRVLFSSAGRTADELIRRLVRAEPPGRVVVVVSDDGEVVSGVRAAGARPVSSRALLGRLNRG